MNKKILFLIMLFMSHFAQSQEVTWDLTFDDKYNLPLIMINYQGEKIQMILDTGSNIALHLPMDLINKIPNKMENSEKIRSVDLLGNITEIKSFVIDRLSLNSFVFKNVKVAEYKKWGLIISSDQTNKSENTNEDKYVIGLGLFDDYVLTINYPESNITISNDISTYLNPNWIAIPFDLNDEGLVVKLSDGVKNYRMVLDTGATVSIIKEKSLSPFSKKLTIPKYNLKYTALEMADLDSVKVEAIIIDSLPDVFEPDGILGSNFFLENIVKIDFKNKQMWIQPAVIK